MIAQYPEVKRDHMVPHGTGAGEDYSILKREDISHALLHNMTAEDYSMLKRDDVPHGQPYGTVIGRDYSTLKREEREVH